MPVCAVTGVAVHCGGSAHDAAELLSDAMRIDVLITFGKAVEIVHQDATQPSLPLLSAARLPNHMFKVVHVALPGTDMPFWWDEDAMNIASQMTTRGVEIAIKSQGYGHFNTDIKEHAEWN